MYFGGGTPSLLSRTQLRTLLAHCRQVFALASDAEITLEANPETVTNERIEGYLAAGVNRISMGVQSLAPSELIDLRRPHTAERTIAAYDAIRRAGCSNINLDLLYGLPGQTVDGWRDTLTRIVDLGPDHLSAYALTPEPGTDVGTAVAQGHLTLPEDDLIEQQETVLHETVRLAGLHRYEISNYSKPGAACRHNLRYWRCDDWLGLGASAHSHLAGCRWWNHFDPMEYIHGVNQQKTVAGSETLSVDQQINEVMAFGLRTVEGVSRARFTQRFGTDPWVLKAPNLTWLIDQGLLEDDRHTLRLTPRGLAMADSVAVSLL